MVTALVPETFFPFRLVYMAWITDFKLDFEISSTINLIQFIIYIFLPNDGHKRYIVI